MNRKLLRYTLIAALLLSGVGGAMLLGKMKPEPATKANVQTASLVEVMPIQAQSVTFSVQSQGTVRPRTETVLSAEVPGSIVSISPKFIVGGVFEAGEELLRIDPSNYEVAVDEAEALLRQRQIEYDGAVKLRDQGYRAEAEYASAAAALASARAGLVRARRNLERTRISLPYPGLVRAKDADLGQYVNVGARLGVVFATDTAEVRLPLTDDDLAFLDLPASADIAVTGRGDGPRVTLTAEQKGRPVSWEARIVRTEGVIDETTRVSYAVASINDPYNRDSIDTDLPPLPIGTFVAAEIDGRTVDGIIPVPRSAIRGNGQIVVVNDENRLEIRNVDILRADAEVAYIQGGLETGELISLTVIENPINGLQVRPDPVEPEARFATGSGRSGK